MKRKINWDHRLKNFVQRWHKVEFATAGSLEDGESNPFTIRPVLFQYLGFPIKSLRIRWKTAVYSTSSTSKSSVPKVHPFALKSSEKVVRIFEGSKRQTCLDVDLKKNERIFEAKNYRVAAGQMLPLRRYSWIANGIGERLRKKFKKRNV